MTHSPLPWDIRIGTTFIAIHAYDGHTVCIDINPERGGSRGREEIIANFRLICDAVNRAEVRP